MRLKKAFTILISQLEIAKANQIDRVILLTHYVPSKDFIIYNNDIRFAKSIWLQTLFDIAFI